MADYKNRELTLNDRLALAAVAVMGMEFAPDAFRLARHITTTNEASFKVMLSRWLNSDAAKEFLASTRRKYTEDILEDYDENKELTDKQLAAIVQKGILSEKDPKKQTDMSLKLLSFRQANPREIEQQEHRRYFLPWRSKCRGCYLMQIYREIAEDRGGVK